MVDRSAAPPPSPASSTYSTYTVRKNDTLYSIAWRNNLEYKALAAANGIKPPYTLYPGQRIHLRAAAAARSPATPSTPAAPAQRPPTRPTVAKPAAAKPPPTRAATPPRSTKPPAKPPPSAPVKATASGWRHPVGVSPERRFGGGSKGFDYALPPQTQIRAAAAGNVVYSGPGLGGYRHLVIVKVSERYLVAYGVNVAPALREGQTVAAGGTIATIPSGGTAAGRFHFEIRDRGKPVDPQTLVGRR